MGNKQDELFKTQYRPQAESSQKRETLSLLNEKTVAWVSKCYGEVEKRESLDCVAMPGHN